MIGAPIFVASQNTSRVNLKLAFSQDRITTQQAAQALSILTKTLRWVHPEKDAFSWDLCKRIIISWDSFPNLLDNIADLKNIRGRICFTINENNVLHAWFDYEDDAVWVRMRF